MRLVRYLALFRVPSTDEIKALTERVDKLGRDLDACHQALAQKLDARTLELEHNAATLADTRFRLDQTKALATLASLVPPLAHDLSAPVGNANLAANALHLRLHTFSAKVRNNQLRRSDLDDFISQLDQGLSIIETAGSRIAELTDSLKHLSIDQASGRRRRFALEDLVNEVVTTLSPSLRKTNIQVTKDLTVTQMLNSYPGPLGQILINLLQNAITHAFAGRSAGSIQISATESAPGWTQIHVCDDGVGMSKHVLQHVFQPFFTTQAHHGGSGIGLANSKQLLERQLGGTISVTSSPQSGTHFIISLPCEAPTGMSDIPSIPPLNPVPAQLPS